LRRETGSRERARDHEDQPDRSKHLSSWKTTDVEAALRET
jgi:hypothetical protein